MGKNCTCPKSNWDSLSCPEHGLDVQTQKKKKTYHAFNMRENITQWDDETRTSQITYTIVYGYDPEEAIADLDERFPNDQWLLVEVTDDVQWSFGAKKVVIAQDVVKHFPERDQEQMKWFEMVKQNGGIKKV